jgi:hypothetical protein
MRGADLIAAARRRIETKLALPTKLETVDESIWLNVDSYTLMQAIAYLVTRLREEFGIREVRFGLEGRARSRTSMSSGRGRRSARRPRWRGRRTYGAGRRSVSPDVEADRRTP